MNLPPRLRIGCAWWALRLSASKWLRYREHPHERLYGAANITEKVIEIANRPSPRVRRRTLVHETLHAIAEEHGLHDILTEAAIRRLERPLEAFLCDNPEWLEIFTTAS